MLPRPTVPASLAELLAVFRPHLTAPSYRTFCALACGLIVAGGRRTVTGMLTGAGLARVWHHGRAHSLFAYARWCPDRLGLTLLRLIVALLMPAGQPIGLAIDDTLFPRRRRRVHAACWTHDGSAIDRRKIGYGNRWVLCAVLVTLPCCSRPVALPVGFWLWRGQGATTPVQLAVQLADLVIETFPDRRIDVVADAAYSSVALRALPERVSWTLRLRRNARLDALAPPRTGRRGRPRLRGARLGTATDLAATAAFTPAGVLRYGARCRIGVACICCLWYEPFHTRTCRVVLVGEGGTTTGYDLALLTTDLISPPAAIVERYAARWSIEVAIFDAKQVTGAGQTRNRLRAAVERTVPFALLVQTLVVLWYAHHGNPAGDLAAARAVSTALTGLPTNAGGRVTAILLTAAALTAWLVSLARQVQDPPILVGCLVGMGLAGAWLSLLHPSGPGFLVSFMAMAEIGLQLPRRIALPAGAIVLLAAGLAQARGSAQPFTAALGVATGAGFLFLAAAFAAASRIQQAQAAALLEQQEQTRLAREQAAVLAERARLARELHDVLAHTLAGLAVHLEAARLLAQTADADSRLVAQVTTAQRLARDGMGEAKRAVSALRNQAQPGPDDLLGVIEQARGGGLPVSYAVTGRPQHLPPETGLAVYRAVQEALTNTAKHAGAAATVTVRVAWGDREVRVEVIDRGGDRSTAAIQEMPSGHYGLAGLAERAALAGGRLTTGPTVDGWRLCLSMPVAALTAPVETAARP